MRAIWKGTVSFGLVSIPVKLFAATEERDVSFHQVRKSDGSRIRYKRVAEADGEEVPFGEIGKGLQLPDGSTVVLTDEDFAGLPLSSTREIDVHEFVPLEQVDPIYFARSYYLEPDKTGVKPYVLLRDALRASSRVALVKVAIRNREQLAVLRVRDEVIVLETMVWPDEVRTPDFAFLDSPVQARPAELTMAEALVASMAADFNPHDFHDEYREALQKVIDAKVEGRQVVEPAAAAVGRSDNVVDLMAALRASVEAARARRTAPAGDPGASIADGEPEPTGVDADSEDGHAEPAPQPAKAAKAGTAARGSTPPGTRARGRKPAKTTQPAESSPAVSAGSTPASRPKRSPARTTRRRSA